ncbi:hypothetical protein RND81_06G135600 [Saponaria officinalis]|uniref:Uncharacterized protein n=1 Tax=Saponaria officinalis TaxID=3572 RepID=A0AAW1KA63_SAPOF
MYHVNDKEMASDAPTWADQWGEGGIGVIDEVAKEESSDNSKKKSPVLGKAKAAAIVGALKVKSGTSMGIKWVKNITPFKKDNNPPK